MQSQFGIVRVSSVVLRMSVADPRSNTDEILSVLAQPEIKDADIVVFPELCISGYSCGDLFHQKQLLSACLQQLDRLVKTAPVEEQLIMVGLPLARDNALYNCVAVINNRKLVGIVPKQFLPNYREFYEARWFAPANNNQTATGESAQSVTVNGADVPFGTRLLFTAGLRNDQASEKHPEEDVTVSTEICEAIWMPVPPSSLAALAGANIICNPSASNETIGKAEYRRNLVVGQSGRCVAGYVYTSSGPTESTNDVVFGGHAMIAQGGHVLAESTRVGDSQATRRESYVISADIDVEKLNTERRTTTTFEDSARSLNIGNYRRIPFTLKATNHQLLRPVPAMPFVPSDPDALNQRCSEIFGIQTAALAKRLDCLGADPKLTIGISGGLDSTLALLVATRTCDLVGLPRTCIRAVTMPGFGTTGKTLANAHALMRHLQVMVNEIDIRPGTLLEYKELAAATGYRPFGVIALDAAMTLEEFNAAVQAVPAEQRVDLVFENVQARRRTELLMNMGFVLGTGDMSEMWLGWCTYNADHQSMYNVNCSIPKTLVKFLVRYVATHQFDGQISETLMSIADTEISPELLPPDASGKIAQRTEDTVGPYELHDFYLYHITRFGFSPAKILYLAANATGWSKEYTEKEHRKWLAENLTRAFTQQYKRDDVPNGPKVGSISLSPRGDWRMPSDASYAAWLEDL